MKDIGRSASAKSVKIYQAIDDISKRGARLLTKLTRLRYSPVPVLITAPTIRWQAWSPQCTWWIAPKEDEKHAKDCENCGNSNENEYRPFADFGIGSQ